MLLLSMLCMIALLFTIACGDDDDDNAADTTAVATAETSIDASPTASEAEATATLEATATEAEGATESATATEEDPAASPTEETEATSTTTASAAVTATEGLGTDASLTTSGSEGEDDPLADVQPIDPEAIPNFIMTFTFDVSGAADQPDTTIGMEIEQASLENYHMSVATGDQNIETWLVDETNYVNQGDGSIIPLPPGTDSNLFSPSIFLQEVPPLDSELQAEREGEEEISGRDTVHYVITGENYLAQADLLTGGNVSDVEGQVEVWIDTELSMMIKQMGDITWTNEDGSNGSFLSDLLIYDIGTTLEVDAPE